MSAQNRLKLNTLAPATQAEIRAMHRRQPVRVLAHYAALYGAVALIWFVCVRALTWGTGWTGGLWALGAWWIAVIQHGLYVIHHDASHFGHFRSKALTRWVGFGLCVVPMLHHPEAWSFEQWRRRHVRHHRHLFTPDDPDYANRSRRGDTTRTYRSRALALACARTGLRSTLDFFMGRQDAVGPGNAPLIPGGHHHLRTLLRPFEDDPIMERERRIKLITLPVILAAIHLTDLWLPFLLLWLLPMYTIYPALLHLMDLTEHIWQRDDQAVSANSRSTSYGILARLFITWYPRPHHREHHLFPGVLCPDLPRLAHLLAEDAHLTPAQRGLPQLLDAVAHP